MLNTDDYIQIQNLIHSYPKFLDSGQLDKMGELFAQATVYFEGVNEPLVNDPRAVSAMFENFLQLYEGKPRTRHAIVNLILEEDGENRAVATSTVVVFQQTDNLPLQPIITGDYQDRFESSDGEWHFSERRITNDLFGDLRAHGRYEFGPE